MNQRATQIDRTRNAILEAAIDAFLGETDPADLTMQALADAAGVSHRTLYRHFPSRKELVNAVGKEVDRKAAESGAWKEIESFDSWTQGVEQTVAFGAAHREQLRRSLAMSIATGEFRTDRDERYWDLFRERFPHLDDETARRAFLCIRTLLSASNVILMAERFGLAPDEMTPVIEFGVDTLLDRVAQMDESVEGASS